eukprot:TRINITY_DN2710_c0_g1_i1.p1 TRINITY_DN2710_c0_g1~~TRINITY_DN2710_c0_g1_i1.p1  ORF type:complete len:203 (-),score=39.54 TRINITY_DN2710_c0_g1_i1:92-700(-)
MCIGLGTSSLFTGERRPKDDDIFDVLGTTDELNASIGLSIELAKKFSSQPNDKQLQLIQQLQEIQCSLLDVGSHVATPRTPETSEARLSRTTFSDSHVVELESWIDNMEKELTPLKNFILPGGGVMSAQLHVARAVCRRAERGIVSLIRTGTVDDVVGRFINRLSDYLFVSARFASMIEGEKETVYKAKTKILHDVSVKNKE